MYGIIFCFYVDFFILEFLVIIKIGFEIGVVIIIYDIYVLLL